ncbi:MAG: alkyl sulfatase dimerization domain-containing protein [Ilumatobacteraceae bacterium]
MTTNPTANAVPASFAADDSLTVTAPNGGLARREMIEHTERFERRLWQVTDRVWCMVGNGLSNQTFVEGPDGLIVVDTGESIQEMAAALAEVRAFTDAPIVAAIYTHFHYVGGTQALLDAGAPADLPIWSHAKVLANRSRQAGEVGPISRSGLIHQFGVLLPDDGPDALTGAGIGRAFRNPEHAPFTEGFLPPTDTFDEPTTITLAGLTIEMTPAPSDADDSVTLWFADLGVCVNNLMWPALFNVFAIRGEEYRDPRVLVAGFDHLLSLGADHLVGAHGPPISGADHIAAELTRSRDAIQFMWDQTVRGVNKGLTHGELIEFVQLPELYDESYLQTQHYGLVEHHTRQIHTGLRGWFDGDESTLFPLPTAERAARLVAGFGGPDAVRTQAEAALADDDVRWALELSSWLARRADAEQSDRDRLAEVLRTIARRTTSANVRNWCLTRSRHLDGTISTDRFRRHRLTPDHAATAPASDLVHVLRVTLDPSRCTGVDRHLAVEFPDGTAGLHVRNAVAVPTSGDDAKVTLTITRTAWADLFNGRRTIGDLLAASDASTSDDAAVTEFWTWFDLD